MTATAVVRPFRFTDDVQAMRGFLELLGLASRIESERGGWVDMVAGAGMVALHDAASSVMGYRAGDTSLSFEVEQADVFAERFAAAGLTATVYDEAYGRVLLVELADGSTLHCDERRHDLSGYVEHSASPDPRTTVVGRWAGPDPALLRPLGQHEVADARLDGGAGEVWLVRAPGLVVRTSEPLVEVRERLRTAGHPVADGPWLTVTDPDGHPMEVHP